MTEQYVYLSENDITLYNILVLSSNRTKIGECPQYFTSNFQSKDIWFECSQIFQEEMDFIGVAPSNGTQQKFFTSPEESIDFTAIFGDDIESGNVLLYNGVYRFDRLSTPCKTVEDCDGFVYSIQQETGPIEYNYTRVECFPPSLDWEVTGCAVVGINFHF